MQQVMPKDGASVLGAPGARCERLPGPDVVLVAGVQTRHGLVPSTCAPSSYTACEYPDDIFFDNLPVMASEQPVRTWRAGSST